MGAGIEYSNKQFMEIMKKEIGFEGDIVWDTSKPNGQPRRLLDISKAQIAFGYQPETDFINGLRKTIEWYLENREVIIHQAPKFV